MESSSEEISPSKEIPQSFDISSLFNNIQKNLLEFYSDKEPKFDFLFKIINLNPLTFQDCENKSLQTKFDMSEFFSSPKNVYG